MLTPPEGLSNDALVRVLDDGWGLTVSAIDYRAVGFGSHHWEAVAADGTRWFVTVDDLDTKRWFSNEPAAAAFGRLRAALGAAGRLRDSGCEFVVAPILTLAGKPLVRAGPRFGVALYPYVAGERYDGAEGFTTPEHRRGVLDLIVSLHSAPVAELGRVMVEDFALPRRDALESSIDSREAVADTGPYAEPASKLLLGNADRIHRLLVRHADLVAELRRAPSPMVVTHGEPHPGNTIRTAAGWVFIDWDTVLVAPPERDLWSLDPGDGSLFEAYALATGTAPRPERLDLYGIRWDLADIAAYVSWFRAPHSGSFDDDKSWNDLSTLIGGLG